MIVEELQLKDQVKLTEYTNNYKSYIFNSNKREAFRICRKMLADVLPVEYLDNFIYDDYMTRKIIKYRITDVNLLKQMRDYVFKIYARRNDEIIRIEDRIKKLRETN